MLTDLLARNLAWAKRRRSQGPDCFTLLAALQAPKSCRPGCSYGRVPVNVAAAPDPGEVFVHCNVASIVQSADLNPLWEQECAVDALNVREIIVCEQSGREARQ